METARSSTQLSRRWTWLSISIIVLVTVALAIIVSLIVQPETSTDGQTCAAKPPGGEVTVNEPAVLLPAENELVNFIWVFDADEPVYRATSLHQWQEPSGRPRSLKVGDELTVRVPKPLTNEANDEYIPADQVATNAVVTANGVLLSLCVDTSDAQPDRYTTVVKFADDDIKSAPFTIDATVKNRAGWIPIVAVMSGIAIALVLLILSLASTEAPKKAEAVVAIALAAGLTLFVGARPWASWQNDPTWGRDNLDWIALAAATALAFIGAMATGDTVQGVVKAASDQRAGSPTTKPDDAATSSDDTAGGDEAQ